ncbi:unnamed protein product, partial [Rotaria socialis]
KKMTFVSPINTITLDCTGNVLPNAILLADVDSTKINKLLVGTQEGELLIFKSNRNPNDVQLWRRAQGLGFITAITVGFLVPKANEPRPIICVVNAEGAIHLFLLRPNIQRSRVRSAGGTATNNRNDSKLQLYGITTLSNDEEQQQIQPAFSQQLICNPKVLLIQDFHETEKQLIISYNDRTIRIFTSMILEEYDGRLSGRILLKHVFNVADQIHTLSSRQMLTSKDYELIVSQPGGNLLRFNPNEENARIIATDITNHTATGWTEAIALDGFFDDTVYATICHDHIDIFSNQLNKILSTIPLSVTTGHLCGLRQLPATKDKQSQLVTISSVDGDTFIIDRHSNIIRFRPPLSSSTVFGSGNDSMAHSHFFDQIQAFTSGLFGDNNTFCFIYVLTHNDKIIIVHSIEINSTRTTNLLTTLPKTIADEKFKDAQSMLEQLKDLLHPHY